MRQSSSAKRLEELCTNIHWDRITLLLPREREDAAEFTVGLRYGQRPRFDAMHEMIRCDGLELVFARQHRKTPLIIPLVYAPELIIEIDGFGELNILRTFTTLALTKEDALLFSILSRFAQTASLNIIGSGRLLWVYLNYQQQVSRRLVLNELQTQWLLDC